MTLGYSKKKPLYIWKIIEGPPNLIQIVTSDETVFALDKDGSVFSWGYSNNGEREQKILTSINQTF